MKRFTKFVSLLLLGAMLLSLCACGTKEAPETTAAVVAETAGTEPEATTETTPAANTVTDVLGREVEIPAAIETIACPGLPSTRMVVYAGAAEKIAGVTENEKMEFICAPCSDVNHALFDALPVIGSGWPNSEIYQEELVMLDPDIIVMFTNDAAQADELQSQTATVIYPAQFADVDFAEKAAEILTMFVGENGAGYVDVLANMGLGFDNVTMFN